MGVIDTCVYVIKDVGFPVFVAVFVLVRLEPALHKLYKAITELTIVAARSNGIQMKEVRDSIRKAEKKKRG